MTHDDLPEVYWCTKCGKEIWVIKAPLSITAQGELLCDKCKDDDDD